MACDCHQKCASVGCEIMVLTSRGPYCKYHHREAERRRPITIIGLKKPGNYLPTNIEYFTIQSSASEADIAACVQGLIKVEGFAHVIVAEVSCNYYRDIRKEAVE